MQTPATTTPTTIDVWPTRAGYWLAVCDCGAESAEPNQATADAWTLDHINRVHPAEIVRVEKVTQAATSPQS